MKKSYILKRIIWTIIIFFIILTICFFLPRIGIDDPCSRYYPAQGNLSDSEYEIIKELTRKEYGLDGSTLSQYIRYLNDLFHGSLGTSYQSGNPKVIDLIASRMPWTLWLSIINMLISLVLGCLIGTYCAFKKGKIADKTLLNMSSIQTAIPSFFIALLLSYFLGFQLEIFPAYTDQNLFSSFDFSWSSINSLLYNAFLPILSMAIGSTISYAQESRNSVIAVSDEDFILLARAKGLSQNQVLYKHMLRNAMLPIATNVGMGISGLLGGSVVIEQIFNWNGIGTLFLEANNNNDYPLMMGIIVFLSGFALLANLVTDFTYSLLDPRVTLGRSTK